MSRKETNRYCVIGNIAVIDVSTERHPDTCTLVDTAQLEWVIDGKGRWRADSKNSDGPAQRVVRGTGGAEVLHRVLLNASSNDGEVVHKNGSGLDNRIDNLKFADRAE